jgi:hypothetical protein
LQTVERLRNEARRKLSRYGNFVHRKTPWFHNPMYRLQKYSNDEVMMQSLDHNMMTVEKNVVALTVWKESFRTKSSLLVCLESFGDIQAYGN